MLASTPTARPDRTPELQSVGVGAWVASDPAAGANDPHRVIAYLERKDSRVYVLWVSGATGVCEFGSLREALSAVSERLGAGRLTTA
jgi:hypothetical protein